MLAIGSDHVATAVGTDAMLLALIPVLWIVGVIVFVTLKFRSR